MAKMSANTLHHLLMQALMAKGFSSINAQALSDQTVLCEELGQHNVGVAHLFDYIDGLDAGRIDGTAIPSVSRPAPTMILVDGQGGLAQTGFDRTFDDLVSGAREWGMTVFLQKNTMLCGSLGTYALRLAEAGLVSFAASNGSPLLAGSGSDKPVFCTNPIAFSAPQEKGSPLLIDQSSSATAYLNIRTAAENNEAIPPGWAIDKNGKPTTDARAAFEGTLLAFGGARGANIALMVDVLAAGLTGANWSLDAPSFTKGDQNPATGLFVLAINPALIDPDFPKRMAAQVKRLASEYGVYIPGMSKTMAREQSARNGIDIDDAMMIRLQLMTGEN